jgi:glycosyltransferase involved in cell wall biosynthesis
MNIITPKISVVTTVYNKEKSIRKCIESILSQSFSDFELILVDDSSKDNSLEICKEYAAKDNRIKIILRENGGHAIARNTGIINSKGDYIIFVDGDDSFSDDHALADLFRIAEIDKSDIVISDFLGSWNTEFVPFQKLTGIKMLEFLISENFYHPTPCSRLFRREVFINNLFENLISDDELWTPVTFYRANVVSILNKSIYCRTTPDDSVTRIDSEQNYFRKANDKSLTAGLVINYFENQQIKTASKSIIYPRFISLYLSGVNIYVNKLNDSNLKNQLLNQLEKNSYVLNFSKYYNNPKHNLLAFVYRYLGFKFLFILFKFLK